MRYLTLFCLLTLCAAIPALAQQQLPTSPAVTPLHGVVTIVAPQGQFYTDLGGAEQLPRGEMLIVYRDGSPIALAQVIKVSNLDSVVQLQPHYRSLVLEAGDVVVVQTTAEVSNLSSNLSSRGGAEES